MTGTTMILHRRIAEIPAHEWDACAGDDNPFASHAFLSALEDSGSTGPATGWLPQHLALRDDAGHLLAVAPLYAKGHSFGEYVFDQQWAQAFTQAGGQYYPKLQVAVPFSPVPGPRLLVGEAPNADARRLLAGRALQQACRELDLSSIHVTFCTQHEYDLLGGNGWLQRLGVQYHWENAGYGSFDDFLDALASRKRKAIRRERRDANACGLTFHAYRGAEITEALWHDFYQFYLSTVDRKWGSAYLQPGFFPLLSERLGDRVVLMVARQDGVPVAGALNLMGRDTLYGRNWGRLSGHDWPFLHFELCYYRAIDFAIEHGLKRVEAGAQGEHKLQRGYRPCLTHSAHWISHPGLRVAVAEFLGHERAAIMAELPALDAMTPYRAGS
ncbi:GNAT family N-acetyltransferase [Komagataeibacter medellinensis]|nr:GNAT family N-acetyltransferase [Komagataeibacter medellinensis]